MERLSRCPTHGREHNQILEYKTRQVNKIVRRLVAYPYLSDVNYTGVEKKCIIRLPTCFGPLKGCEGKRE